MGVKFLLFHKAGAVDALEHLVLAVAAPVRAGAVHQLDGVALDAAGAVQVGACAQIHKLALLVEAYGGVLGQVVYQLDLVRLIALLHELERLVAGQLEALDGQLLLAYLAHLGLELFKDLRREGHVGIDVVVETVVNRGTDGQLCLGVQALYRLGEDVAGGMTVGVAVFLVLKRVQVFLLVHLQYLQKCLRGCVQRPRRVFSQK